VARLYRGPSRMADARRIGVQRVFNGDVRVLA
jgi:hypothetical protein